MPKVQGKKAAAAGKNVAKKVVARGKSAAGATKKKPSTRVPAATGKSSAAKKPVKKTAAAKPKKAAKAPKPVVKRAGKQAVAKAKAVVKTPRLAKASKKSSGALKKAAKSVASVATKAAKKAVKAVVAKAAPPARAVVKAAGKTKSAGAAVAKAASTATAKAAAAPAKLPATKKLKAVPPASERVSKPVAAPPVPAPAAAEPEKKRGRRARTRIHSDGSPAAAWLSTEKPRPASFIPAPPRAEAPSAIAAAPASSDRLIRPDDIDHPAVRTVPIRIDVEQSGGRYFLIAQPTEVTVRPGEGIEWDFRYLGGADISVEEIVVEFEKPAPFASAVFRTRKPGGARPHRQMSGAVLPAAAGRRIEYTVRAVTPFKSELASARVVVNVTS